MAVASFYGIIGCGSPSADGGSDAAFIIEDKSAHVVSAYEDTNAAATSTQGASDGAGSEATFVSNPDFGVWYPYWDYATATQELDNYGSRVNTISFFAAYFDVNGKAFIPENTTETYKQLKKASKLKGKTTYLTFVNDKLLAKGSSLKDTQLLYDLIGDPNKAATHVDEVVALSRQLGCDGIEIDYEAIKKDNTLWGYFNTFATLLAQRCQAESIPLRIVFEPSAPIGNYTWPSNAEYVMMCYNLNGYGTAAGPKANMEWLQTLCSKMKTLPGTVNMALATGGFDFSATGEVKQINYCDAVAQMKAAGATAQRDPASADMHFSYTDASGISHEVWYADQETIETWIKTINTCGINRITIWRLGGNIA